MFITVRELAEILRLHPSTVTRMTRGGHFPGAFKPARSWLYDREVIRQWLATR